MGLGAVTRIVSAAAAETTNSSHPTRINSVTSIRRGGTGRRRTTVATTRRHAARTTSKLVVATEGMPRIAATVRIATGTHRQIISRRRAAPTVTRDTRTAAAAAALTGNATMAMHRPHVPTATMCTQLVEETEDPSVLVVATTAVTDLMVAEVVGAEEAAIIKGG